MRILRITFIFIFVIISLYLLGSLFIPGQYKVERSVLINAPADIVFEQMASFKRWEKWNEFSANDPEIKSLFGGQNGKVNSYWLWKSKQSGKGRITTTAFKDQSLVSYHLTMESPFKSESDGSLIIETNENQTKVTWLVEGTNPFHLKVLNLIMDKKIGPDCVKGLGRLKEISEKESSILQNEYFGYRIKETKFNGTKIGYIKKAIIIDELNEFFIKSYNKIKEEASNCNFKIEASPLALYYRWDNTNGVATVAAALPLTGDSTLGNDIGLMQLQTQKALLLNYYGGYKSTQKAYKALDNYLINKNLRLSRPVIEEYIIGPKQQADSSRWYTKIWYLLSS
jgi:effector-binding domain-containing protein